jgi:hypothetical protein
MSATGPVSTMRPSFITHTRSAWRRTMVRSWLINSRARPRFSFCSVSRSRICAWMVTSSAVVVSSAISSGGSLARAAAIITRCRWPPESWCGKASSRPAASGKPQDSSSATILARVGRLPCSRSASAICRPMRCSGLRLVIGSWKIMPAVRPRMFRSTPGEAVITSVPSSTTRPDTAAPGGSRRSAANAVSDLPEPLSPTSASVSPRSSERDTPSTTALSPNRMVRSSMASRLIAAAAWGRTNPAPPRRRRSAAPRFPPAPRRR